MKLLSRFIWLIIGISIVVFVGISLAKYSADKKFEEIKQSISNEYYLLAGKMLKTEESTIFSYNYDVCNSSTTKRFFDGVFPDKDLLQLDLDSAVLNFFNIDGIWFYKNDGSQFYFHANKIFDNNLLSFIDEDIVEMFKKTSNPDFHLFNNNIFYRVVGSKVGDINNPLGYILSVSEQNYRWINYYEKELNNSFVSFVKSDEIVNEVSKDIIQLQLPLENNKKQAIGSMLIKLKLPFLALWKDANAANNFLIVGALVVILIFLIVFISLWVVVPLRNISASLKNSSSSEIQPLIKSSTEMGDVARMIGDYHKKKEELEVSESIKRYIIEQAQVGIVIVDSKSNLILTANPYACELMSAPEEAIIGNAHVNFLESYEKIRDRLDTNEGESLSHESTLYNAKGEEIPILRNVKQIFMDGRHVFMETFVDLSQTKDLQSKLEEEKLKLNLAMKNSGLNFCEYDFKIGSLLIADDWSFLTKGDSKILIENILKNIYPTDIKSITDQIDVIESGQRDTFTKEFRIKHPVLGLIWLSLSVLITKRDEQNKPKQLIGLFEDVTERINVQQELIKAKEKAEESDRMKTSYLANMSHKVRTPMNAIVGFANLLTEEDITTEEKDTYIKIIGRDTEQLLHLIDDIINIAQIDANQLDVNKNEIHINDLINDLSNYFKTNEKTNRIKFESKTMLPNGKDLIITDGNKLKNVMENLLNNSFKFTSDGEIELGYFVNPVAQKIILYVKDTGIGIPDDAKDKVFNRFYQIDSQVEGTGLGLTISQGLVKMLNGSLYYDSKQGIGTTFYVELPM